MGSGDKVELGKAGAFDTEIYGGGDEKDSYITELPTADEEAALEAASLGGGSHPATKNAVKASKSLLEQGAGLDEGHDPFQQYRESGGSGLVNTRISDREGEVCVFDVVSPFFDMCIVCLCCSTDNRGSTECFLLIEVQKM